MYFSAFQQAHHRRNRCSALADHYGFTREELDFIINYDIKYRLGADADEEVTTAVILNAEITTISLNDTRSSVPAQAWVAGPADILDNDKTGFVCSSQCPGGVILKTFDVL